MWESGGFPADPAQRAVPRAWLRCLKPLDRAMAKALLRYDGDASRLLDVCRARVVFDTAAELVECLRLVSRPSAGARIRRIRSSMLPGSEEALAGGFRVRPRPPPPTSPP